MAVSNPREVFVHLLSDVRQNSERSAKFYQEISQLAQQPEIKEALEARAFVSNKTLATLDQCFKLIGEQPVKLSGRIQEVFCRRLPQGTRRDTEPGGKAPVHSGQAQPPH